MIWVALTNYFADQITTIAGSFLDWPKPLSLSFNQLDNKNQKPVTNQLAEAPQAIIILGSGRRNGALDPPLGYQNQDVSSGSMERLRLGARLAKAIHLPVLVTGGAPDRANQEDLPEAILMSHVLQA